MKILITRPKEWTNTLNECLQALGHTVEFFPTIEIGPTLNQTALRAAVQKLFEMDMVLFASRSAVFHGMRAIQDYYFGQALNFKQLVLKESTSSITSLNEILQFASLGPGTKAALQEFGIEGIITPENPPFESESLLALPEFQFIEGSQMMLFRGNGGRNLLPGILKSRGAEVQVVECYTRCLPTISKEVMSQQLKAWRKNPFDVIITTSLEVLNNLYLLVGEKDWQWFCEIPMILVGNRMFERAKSLQVRRVHSALGASDHLLIEALAPVSLREY